MKKLLKNLAITLLLLSPGITWAQVTWTIPTTVQITNVSKIGVVHGPSGSNRQTILLRDYAFELGGSMQPAEFTFTAACSSSSSNSSTVWYNSQSISGVYPFGVNQLVGANPANYIAIQASTGNVIGTGTITANTSNSSTGMTFTLSNPLSTGAACSSASDADMLFVRWQPVAGSLAPNVYDTNVPSAISFETTDLPSVTGAVQAYSIPTTAGSINYGIDQGSPFWTDPAGGHNSIGVNFNGSYVLDFWEKCPTAGCSIPWSVQRNGTNLPGTGASGTDTPGTTWTHVTHTMALTENGTQSNYNAILNISASGSTAYVWGIHFTEGTAYPGNTTAFRDADFKKLKSLNLNSIRFMYPEMWSVSLTHYLMPDGQVTFSNSGLPYGGGAGKLLAYPSYGVQDDLNLCYALGITKCWITLPKLLITTSLISGINEAATLSTFMSEGCNLSGCPGTSSQSWNSMLTAANITPFFELGNEGWNDGAGIYENSGSGTAYGTLMGPFVHLFKTDPNYNSRNKLITNQQGDATGQGQFNYKAMAKMGCTNLSSTPTYCPDLTGGAFYKMTAYNDTSNTIINGGLGEINYQQTRVSTQGSCTDYQTTHSFYFSNSFNTACYGMGTAIYESNTNPQSGSASPTQLQINQQYDSVGGAIISISSLIAMAREDSYGGPLNLFAESDFGTSGYQNNSGTSYYFNAWNANTAIPDGPGQVNTQDTSIDLPELILLRQVNTDIGSNTNLLADSTSGVPVIASYAGTSNDSVPAQTNVPLMRFASYANSANTSATGVITNYDPSTTYTVTTNGADAFAGTVTEKIFGGSAANCTANNNSSYFQGSIAPSVVDATPTTFTGSSVSVPPCSVVTMTWAIGGSTPQVATPTFSPAAGTYTSAQTVAITSSTSGGVGLCYTTDGSTPTSSGTACTHGTSLANGGTVSVATTQTLNAIGYLSGDTTSSVGTAAYTITPQAAAPTLSPAAGSYASAQSVTPSSSTPGATFLSCIGVGCTPSTPVSGTISVTSSETIGVLTQASGYSNSTVTYAAYVINGTLPTPTFSPAAGNYSTAQSVAISDAVSGTSIYYTTNGSTPTTGSTLYTGPIAVSTNQTVQAIAVKSGYTNSSVGSAAYTFTMTGVNLNCSGTVTILPSTILH